MPRTYKSSLLLSLLVCFVVMLTGREAQAAPRESIIYADLSGTGEVFRVDPDVTDTPVLVGSGLADKPGRVVPASNPSIIVSSTEQLRLVSSDPGGQSMTDLTPPGLSLNHYYAISPAGDQIAYSAYANPNFTTAVYIMNLDGSGNIKRTNPTQSQSVFDWGASGILINDAFGTSFARPLYRLDPGTGTQMLLGPSDLWVMDARYSPDGSKIAMVAQYVSAGVARIMIMNADGTGLQAITTTPLELVPYSLDWAPTGDRLAVAAFSGEEPEGGSAAIHIVDVATGAVTTLEQTRATYLDYVTWGYLEDPLPPTTINTVNASAQYSDAATLMANLSTSGVPLPGKTVGFKINGVTIPQTAITDAAGNASVAYPLTVSAGTYTLEAFFAGDPQYLSSTTAPLNNRTLSVGLENAVIAYTGAIIADGSPLTMSAQVTPEADGTAGDLTLIGNLTFTVRMAGSGTLVGTYTAPVSAGGSASTSVPLPVGAYDVTVAMAPNTYYTAPAVTTRILARADMAVPAVSGEYSDKVTLQATLTSGGSPVVNKLVTFSVNGVSVGTGVTDANGLAQFVYTIAQAAGNYPVSAAFSTDGTYATATGSGTLTVTPESASIVYDGDTESTGGAFVLGATVTQSADGSLGDITLAGVVRFTLVRVATGTTDFTFDAAVTATGRATYNVGLLPARTYTVQATLLTPNRFTAPAATATILGKPVMTAADTAGVYSDGTTLTATLTLDGSALSGKTVAFAVDGTPVGSAVTNGSGTASLPYTVAVGQGTHTITATFAGDGTAGSATDTAALTASRESATLTYTGDTVATGGAQNLKAHLDQDADGSPGIITNAGTVTFTVARKADNVLVGTYTAPVDAAGDASFTTPALPATAYTVTAALDTNLYFTAASATGTLRAPTSLALTIPAGTYSDSISLSARVMSGGTPVQGALVTFTVDGTGVGTAVTGATGYATITYTVTSGQGSYPVGASFAGDASYLTSSDTGTLAVGHETAVLAYTGGGVANGTALSLSATITEAPDPTPGTIANAGTVEFLVTRVSDSFTVGTYTAPVTAAGTASTTSAILPPDVYSVAVSLQPNNYYTAAPVMATIKAQTSLSVTASATQYSDVTTLTATLSPAVSGKSIQFQVDGTNVGPAITNAAGVATVSYPVTLAAGSYPVLASFAGDSDYSNSSASTTVTVSHEDGALAYTGDANSGNNTPITLRAKVTEAVDGSAGDLTRAGPVEFVVTRVADGVVVGTYLAPIAADGTAAVTTPNLPGRTYSVLVRLRSPNNYYTAADTTSTIYGLTQLVVDPKAGQYSDAVNLTATMTVDAVPLGGQTVTFQLAGVSLGTAVTDASGVATFPYTIALGAGGPAIRADFAGGGGYTPATDTDTLTVTREDATLAYNGDTNMPADGKINLSATITQAADGAPGNIVNAGSIEFTVRQLNGTVAWTGTAPVTAGGTAAITTAVLPNEAYNITAALVSNSYFTAANATGKVKSTASLSVPAVSGQYSDSVALTANFTPAALGKTVTFTVNGVAAGSGITNAAGVATAPYSIALPAGTYTIAADFAGDADYTTANNTGTLTVAREDAVLAYTGDTVTAGGALNLSATVTQAADGALGNIILASDVRFTVKKVSDGSTAAEVDTSVNASGVATATTPVLLNEPFTVEVTLAPGNNYFTAPMATGTVKATTSLTATGDSVQHSDDATLTATLSPALSGRTVTFAIGGTTLGTAATVGGVATLTYTVQVPAGNHTVDVTFAAEPNYTGASTTATLVVAHEDATLQYTGDANSGNNTPITLSALVTQAADGSPGDITNASLVEFVLTRVSDGVVAGTYTAPVLPDGTATVATGNLPGRTYSATVRLQNPNDYYTAAAVASTIFGTTQLTTDAKSGQYSDSVDLTATLQVDGSALAGQTVTFAVDGAPVGSAITDASGVASLPYTIVGGAGSYTITASYSGGGVYLPGTDTDALTVTKEDATLAYNGDTNMPADGKINLSATITQAADGAPGNIVNAGSVEFTVRQLNGTVAWTGTAPVTAGGTAAITTAVLPNEAYNITAALVSNSYFTAADATGKVKSTASLSVPAVSGQYSDSVTLTANFTPAAMGKTVTFTVNGVAAGSGITNAAGVATAPYSIALPAGAYTIAANFAGDADYTTANNTGTLTVAREDAALAYTGDTVTAGGALNLSATVTQAADGADGNIILASDVRFTVKKVSDGSTVATVDSPVDAAGVATGTTAVLPNEPYTVDVSLVTPNDYFAATTVTAIVKATTSLTATGDSVQYSDGATLTATLSHGLTGRTVTFSIGGTAIGTPSTGAGGVATLPYTADRQANFYIVDVTFAAEVYYTGASTTATLTISHEDATLQYVGDTLSGNNTPITLKAQVTQAADGSPGDITNASLVEFVLTRVADSVVVGTYTAPVLADGTATVATGNLPGRTYRVDVQLQNPNNWYSAPAISADIFGTTVLVTDAKAGQYSDGVSLTASLSVDSVPLSGQTVTFAVNGATIGSAPTDAAGVATLPYTIDLGAGTHTIAASFTGGGTYGPASDTDDLTVTREDATLAYTGDIFMPPGGQLTLSATIAEAADGSLGTITNAGDVQFTVKQLNGTQAWQGTAPVTAGGTASVTTPVLANEAYNIEVTLVPNLYYTAPMAPGHVKAAASLAVPPVSGQYSDSVTLTANFSPAAVGKAVTFTVDGVAAGSGITNAAGVATAPYSINLPAGTYTVAANFAGDADYTAANNTGTLTVAQEDATLAYTGDAVTAGGALSLSATVTEAADGALGNITLASDVRFTVRKVSDSSLVTTVDLPVNASGVASGSTAALPNEPYSVEVTLVPGNTHYSAAPANAIVKATPSLTATGANGQYSDNVSFTATLSPAMAGKTIDFSIGGTSIGTALTDISGAVTLMHLIGRDANSYTVTVSFAGDANYVAASTTTTLDVTQEDATLTYTGDTQSGNNTPITLRAQVTQAADGSLGDITRASLVEFVLTLAVDNSAVGTYTANVAADGTATVTTGNLAGRTYKVLVRIQSPNGWYAAAPVNATIAGTTTLTTDPKAGQYSDGVTLSGTLLVDGSPLVGQTVTFLVDGSTIGTATTVAGGVVTLPYTITQGAGAYDITLTYDGGGVFVPANDTDTLTVNHEDATLAYTGVTVVPPSGILDLSATIAQAADGSPGTLTNAGNVRFTVKQLNGTVAWTGTAPVIAGGTASVATPALANEAYNIEVTLEPNSYYAAPMATGHAQATASLSVPPVAGQYSDSVTLTANFSPAAAGKTVTFTVDGVAAGSGLTNAAGVATAPYTINLPAGTYTIGASFAGDADYTTANNTGTLTVSQEDAILAYSGDLAGTGAALNLSATVTQAADGVPGDITLASNVRFTVKKVSDGSIVATVDRPVNGTGTATGTTAILPNEPYTVEVTLVPGNTYFTATMASATVKATTSLTATNGAAQYSDSATLTATLSPALIGRTVTFAIGGTTIGTPVTDASGVATLTYVVDRPAGTYTVDISFAADANYTGTSTTAALTVTREDATLQYIGDTLSGNNVPLTLKAQVTQAADGAEGNITLAGPVEFIVTLAADSTPVGTYSAAVAADGTATVATGNLPGRSYKVQVRLQAANGYYTAPAITADIYGTTTLTPANQSGQYSDGVSLTATLLMDGVALGNQTVTFTVNGTGVGSTLTDASGVATLPYTIGLGAGSYTIAADFNGGGTYTPATGTASLTVTREDATLVYNGDTFMPASGELNLSATMTQAADGSLGTITLAGDLQFTVKQLNGTQVWQGTAPVTAGGTASVTTPALANEAYNIEVTLVANSYYTAPMAPCHVKATASLSVPAVSGQYSDSVSLTANFSPAAVGKTVTFTVNGAAAGSGVTNAAGVATAPYLINLQAGTYTITADFAGDGDYTAANNTGTLTVTQEDATLAYTGDMVTAGGTLNLSATVTQAADGALGNITLASDVRFTVKKVSDGSTVATVDAAVGAGGVATGTAPVTNEPHTVEVTLVSPNNWFQAPMATGNVRGTTTLTATGASGQYSDEVTLTATVSPALAGRTITFTIGGTTLGTPATDAAGFAALTYKIDQAAGTHTVTATFPVEAGWTGSTATANLTVTREDATIAYTGDTVSGVNVPLTLTAQVTQAADGSLGDITRAGVVDFIVTRVIDGTSVGTYTGTVNASGVATVTTPALPNRTYSVLVRLRANDYYTAPDVTATILGTTSLTVADKTVQYSDSANLTGQLLIDGTPISGLTVNIAVDGTAVGPTTTDASGNFSLPYLATLGAGTYTIDATFDGGGTYANASGSGTLTVNHENATLAYSGDTAMSMSGQLNLSATVTQAADGSLGNIQNAGQVVFTLKKLDNSVAWTGSIPVTAGGTAAVTTPVLANEPYNVELTLAANSYYTAPMAPAKIKATAALAVSSANGQYSDSVTLTATLSPAAAGKSISFTVNGGLPVWANTDAAGVATVSYSIGLGAGSYTIAASFAGDADYTPANNTGTLTVNQEDATLAYNGQTVTTGGALSLSAQVTQAADGAPGNIALAGPVQFLVKRVSDGTTAATVTSAVNAGGAATATTAALANEPYTVEVTLVTPNNYYTAPMATGTVKATPSLTVLAASGQYSDNVTLTATVSPALAGRTITFSVGATVVGTGLTDAAGTATYTYKIDEAAGSHTITASFPAEANYDTASNTGTLTVAKEDAALTYTGDANAGNNTPITLRAQVTQAGDGSLGDITRAGPVDFVVTRTSDGLSIGTFTGTVDASGAATATTGNLPNRNYTVVVQLRTNNYYTASNVTTQVYATSSLTVGSTSGQYSDSVNLTATLQVDGVAISGQTVSFTVNGVAAGSAITDASGVATKPYSIGLGFGTYAITADFAASAPYTAATGNGTLTVDREDATLAYTGSTSLPGTNRLSLSATVTQAPDGALGNILNAGQVTFTVKRMNGTVVWTGNAPVQATGSTTTVQTAVLANEPYNIEVTLAANNYYTATMVTAHTQARTSLSVAAVSGQYSDQVNLQVTFNPTVAGKTVNFTVGGVAAGSAITDASGVATLPYTINRAAGNYTIGASFTADADYTAATASGTLTVTQEDATLAYTGTTVATGGALNVSAQVTQAADGWPGNITLASNVQFTVRRVSDNAVVSVEEVSVNSSGVASAVTTALPNVAYTVTVALMSPNNYYTATPVTATILQGRTVTVNSPTVQYSDSTAITATLSPSASAVPVRFYLNGVLVATVNTNGSGVATYNYTATGPAATYPIEVQVDPTATATGDTDTGTLTVQPESATLTYTGATARGNSGNFRLEATVTQEADGALGNLTLAWVRFTFTSMTNGSVYNYTLQADAAGHVSQNVNDLPKDSYSLVIDIRPDGYFTAPPVTVGIGSANTGPGVMAR